MKKYLAFVLSISLLLPLTAGAATIESNKLYQLGEGESIKDNAYLAGEKIEIKGTSVEDLYAAGGKIIISGPVGKDAMLLGGQIEVSSVINQDLRIGGGEVLVEDAVGGDLVVLGGQIDIRGTTTVGEDLVLVGGQITTMARVNGRVRATGGEVRIGGTIEGPVTVYGGKVTVLDGATIGGDFIYYSSEEATISETAVIKGEILHRARPDQVVGGSNWGKGDFSRGGFGVFRFLSMLLIALVGFWFFRKKLTVLTHESVKNTGKDFLRGLLILAAAPIIILGLLMTIVGMPLSFALIAAYILSLILSAGFSGIVFGVMSKKYIFKKMGELDVWVVILGTLALHVIGFIPVLGFITRFVFMVITFGTLLGFFYRKVWLD